MSSKKSMVLNNKLYNEELTPEIKKIREGVADIYEKLEKNIPLTKKEKERFEKSIVAERKEFEKPVYVEKLKLLPKELYFGNLTEGEQFQILVRYLNDLAVFNKNMMSLLATLTNYVAIISKVALNVDVDEEMEKIHKEFENQIKQKN